MQTADQFGTNKNGSANQNYCCYCYKDGVFVQDCTMGGMIEFKEGWGFNCKTFVERLRFRPMTRRDWCYSLVALVVIGLLTGGIMVAAVD